MKITFTTEELAKLAELKNDFLFVHPIPMVRNEEGEEVPEFDNPMAWLQTYLKRHLIHEFARGKQARLKAEINFQKDNTLVE